MELMQSLDVTSQCNWSFVEQRQCISFVLKISEGKQINLNRLRMISTSYSFACERRPTCYLQNTSKSHWKTKQSWLLRG